MSGKLQQIAELVLKACLRKRPWRPTTRDIQRRFNLNEVQVAKVKRYTKKLAAERGVMWGFDPYLGYFQVAPHNAQGIADRMTRYQLQHWKDAGRSSAYVFQGAYAQSYISKQTRDEVQELAALFDDRLSLVRKDIKGNNLRRVA